MKLGLGVHTPHGGWWDSHLVQGRLGALVRLRSQSSGEATGRGSRIVASGLPAHEENNGYLVLTGTGDAETGSTSDGRSLPPRCARKAVGQKGT